ncbi:MAG: DUF202 domain-containing protein [Candidatus Nanopelagicales bacterium]
MSPTGGAWSDRPSDTGLAGERTTLAWSRMGLSLLSIPTALLAYSTGRTTFAASAASVAFLLGLVMLVVSLRRQRVDPDAILSGRLGPAGTLVLLTGASVLMLEISAVILILS